VFVPGIRAGGRYAVCADLLFAMSVVCGIIYENRRAASVIAFVFGIISDVFLTPPMHLSPILFFFSAYYAAKSVGVFTRINATTAAVSSIPFFLIRSVVGCVYTVSKNDGTSLGFVLKNTVLPELAFNVTAVFFTYFAVSFLYKWAKRRFFII
jgi:cell shape-determining protein MreD